MEMLTLQRAIDQFNQSEADSAHKTGLVAVRLDDFNEGYMEIHKDNVVVGSCYNGRWEVWLDGYRACMSVIEKKNKERITLCEYWQELCADD